MGGAGLPHWGARAVGPSARRPTSYTGCAALSRRWRRAPRLHPHELSDCPRRPRRPPMLWKLCSRPVVTVSPDATVEEAARAMRTKNVGAVVVVRDGRPAGILTDRDVAIGSVRPAPAHTPLSASCPARPPPTNQ